MMPIDLLVARDVMATSFIVAAITLVVTVFWMRNLPPESRKRQLGLTLPSIIWCIHAVTFYTYTFFIKPRWDPIPENDIWYFAWGAAIITHAAFNALGVVITRIKIDGC